MNQDKIEFPTLMKDSLKSFLNDVCSVKTYINVEFEKSDNNADILIITSDKDIKDVYILVLAFKYGWFARDVMDKAGNILKTI